MEFEAIDGAEFEAIEAALRAAECSRAPQPARPAPAPFPPCPPYAPPPGATSSFAGGVVGAASSSAAAARAPARPGWLAPPPWPAPGQAHPPQPPQLRLQLPQPSAPHPPAAQQQQQQQQPQQQPGSPPGPPRPCATAWLSLLPDCRVEVHYSPQDCRPLFDALAAQPGGSQAGRGPWTFGGARQAQAALAALRRLAFVRVAVEPATPCAAAALTFVASGLASDDEVEAAFGRVPAPLRARLFPFQAEGVRYVLRRNGRGLIGDEMGLGKTVQAVALLAAYSADWPALVLCPASLRDTWAAALDEWLPPDARPAGGAAVVSTAAGAGPAVRGAGRRSVVVLSYSLLAKVPDGALAPGHFGVVVADESHYLKAKGAKRTRLALPLLRAARRCVCLTGTAALNRPMELFGQLSAVAPAVFHGNERAFAARYCAGGPGGTGGGGGIGGAGAGAGGGGGGFGGAPGDRGCSHADELFRVLQAVALVRRLKANVLTQLPAKTRARVPLRVKATAAVQRLYDQCSSGGSGGGGGGGGWDEPGAGAAAEAAADDDGLGAAPPPPAAAGRDAMMRLYDETAKAKAPACADYMRELLECAPPTAKVLFFAHHACVLDAVEAELSSSRTPWMRIDGSTPVGERAGRVAAFQVPTAVNARAPRVALLSIKAAGVGLTLTAASTVVFGELTWTPGELLQAEDRAHRIGQQSCVAVHILTAAGTADDFLWRAVQAKLGSLGRVLDGAARGLDAETRAEGAAVMVPGGAGSIEAAMAKACAAAADAAAAAAGGHRPGSIGALFARAPPPRAAAAEQQQQPARADGAAAAAAAASPQLQPQGRLAPARQGGPADKENGRGGGGAAARAWNAAFEADGAGAGGGDGGGWGPPPPAKQPRAAGAGSPGWDDWA